MTTMNPPIFIPPNSVVSPDSPQKRILVLGDPGTGKTRFALSAPNPFVLDFDNQLSKFKKDDTDFGRDLPAEIPSYPFYDPDAINKILGSSIRPIALLTFLKNDGKKLASNQTLIIDSLSILNDTVHTHFWNLTPEAKGTKEKDVFTYWDLIKDYYTDVHIVLLTLKCHVIVCAHLKPVYSKTGGTIIGYKPLIEGGFNQKIGNYYSDVLCTQVKTKLGAKQDDNRKVNVEYLLQIHTDEYVQCKTTRKDKSLMYIPANFSELMK